MLTMRDYQVRCIDACFNEWLTVKSTLLVVPTGGGKTAIAAEIIKRFQPKKTMFIAHREELIWQARDKIEAFAGLDSGIEMGELYTGTTLFGGQAVVVATVQTLNSNHGGRTRMSRFNPSEFGLLVIDEAHRGTAKTYGNVIHYFTQNQELKVLCITATPDRADEEALGQICDTVAFDYEILDAIHDGWLVPIHQQFVHINGLDFSAMRTTAGDLNGADLAAVMEAEQNLQGVAGATLEIIEDRRTIVFTSSVRQAEVLSNIFNRHRVGMANWVCGKTNKDTRRQMLRDFSDNKFQVICNCGVLTEGYDDWGVACIVMARPTKSRSLYSQMAGRATRPAEGLVDPLPTPEARREAIASSSKASCLLIDFCGNSGRHKLMSSADILGGKVSDDAIARSVKIAQQKGGNVNMTELLEESEKDIQAEMKQRQADEEARKARLLAKVRYSTKIIDPFDAWDIDPVRERGWDQGKTLSEKQRHLLMKQGIDPDTMHYSAAKAVLNEMFRRWNSHLCSLKQAALLKKHGFEAKDLTMTQAKTLIDQIAANGWKRPAKLEVPVIANQEFHEPNPFNE